MLQRVSSVAFGEKERPWELILSITNYLQSEIELQWSKEYCDVERERKNDHVFSDWMWFFLLQTDCSLSVEHNLKESYVEKGLFCLRWRKRGHFQYSYRYKLTAYFPIFTIRKRVRFSAWALRQSYVNPKCRKREGRRSWDVSISEKCRSHERKAGQHSNLSTDRKVRTIQSCMT